MAKRKIIVTVAQTGNFQGKAQNPNLPEQPWEIIQSAYDCYNAGASIVHVHARNKEGKSCNDPEIFAEINSGIRAKCPIIIQNSSAPATRDNAQTDDGLGVLEIKDPSCWPEMCSLDTSLMTTTWNDLEFIYMWTRKWLIKTAKRIKDMGIKPEIECFDPTSVEDTFKYLYPAGVLDDPVSITLVMGMDKVSQGAISCTQTNIDYMINLVKECAAEANVKEPVNLTTMAIGAKQLTGTVFGMLRGTGIRTGMEDNINYAYHQLAESNAQLVERIVRIIHELDMEVATPEEAREILKMPQLKDWKPGYKQVRGGI
ncbi:MAG: 3-keto-5-aminohexanoate cleavage protein [Clostridiales bacterium]|jgi:3-keto-5-aminohexanoate cleavage enzyme|nr:3-keto-5-aminohexanoate cleavage protein [Clostridiales bacterium]